MYVALNDSLANVQTSLTEQQGKMLDRGITVLSSVRFDDSNALINDATIKDNAAAAKEVSALMDLSSIENGVILHQTSEAELLNSSLLPRAISRLTRDLKAGETAVYKSTNSAAKSGALKAAASDLNTERGELETFITAYTKRIVAEESIKYLDDRLKATESWFAFIPADDFEANAQTCVQNHITFLSQLRLQISQEINGDTLAQLLEQKASLQTDYLTALDNNDLTGAQAIESKISDIDSKIDAATADTNAQIADLEKDISDKQSEVNKAKGADKKAKESELNMLKAQLTALSSSLSPDSVGSLAASLRSEALSVVENGGNTADLTNAINSLGDMMDLNSKVAFPAAKDIYDAIQKKNALDGGKAFNTQVKKLESLLTDGKAAYDAAVSGDKSASAIQDIANSVMGGQNGDSDLSKSTGAGSGTGTGAGAGFDINSGKGAIAYINALKEFSEASGGETAAHMMLAAAQKQLNLGNPFVYKKLDDPVMQYLPVTAVRAWYGARYVWNHNLSNAVLTRGAEYYSFTSWSDTVARSKKKDKSDTMTNMAGFLGCIYIPGSYTEETFKCEPVYLPDSDLGILMGADIQKMSDAILELLMK
jgi:hypothetical protein